MMQRINTPLPLENGDRVTRAEFERRYAAMPHVKHAELIERVVYMSSPVRVTHGAPHADIMGWLWLYSMATPGVQLADNTTVRLDLENEPQPDALLRIMNDGQSTISTDGYIEGAPELIVEIAASSASYDLREKLRVYRRNGVRDYLIWQVHEQKLTWFYWQAGEYIQQEPDENGVIKSRHFPGLWLAVDALVNGDLGQVRQILEQGLATSAEHQQFVQQLAQQTPNF